MTLLSALAGDAEIEALLADDAQIAAMLAFEQALADASAEAGWITAGAAADIAAAIDGYVPDRAGLLSGIARDGVVVPALVSQLRARVSEPHRAALHRGATSQDVIDTALMLQLHKVVAVLDARLRSIVQRIEAMSATDGHRPLMAHTRMQAALPFTVAAKLAAWADPLRRHIEALEAARRGLLAVQLGGPVGDRSSFAGFGDAIARGVAGRLGLADAQPWHAARDRVAAFGSLMALISGSLGKIGADVALMAQNEVAAVRLTGGGGSSAMAHKSNPVNAEVLVSLARYNAGLAGTLNQALVHENERSGAAWTLEWLTLPAMAITAGASLRLGIALLQQLHFD